MRSFLYKLSILITIAWAMVLLPSPFSALSLFLKNGLVVIFTVFYTGKMLYDTLFYDHYRP
jgi:hypothetical protein